MKKLLAMLLAAVMAIGLSACDSGTETNAQGSGGNTSGVKKIGVSMPTQSLQRWNQDGSNMKEMLEAEGYEVDLQYGGNNDIATQVSQVENMISSECDILVIAAIDGESLTAALEQAKAKGIQVIAYDRLIMNSDSVSYYATFDNHQVGVLQGQYIADSLDLENAGSTTFNIELFTGPLDDNNVNFFWDGAMSILEPYINDGVLKLQSDQTSKGQAATSEWSTEESQKRMENLISSIGYSSSGVKLDAVLASNDSVANGVTNALSAAGYTSDSMPIITGQDCDITSVKNLLSGTQSMSVFKDTRTLADQVVKMVTAIVNGTEPEINDTTSYDNGTGIIPTYLCDPVVCTIDNYEKLLIDSGYYMKSDLS